MLVTCRDLFVITSLNTLSVSPGVSISSTELLFSFHVFLVESARFYSLVHLFRAHQCLLEMSGEVGSERSRGNGFHLALALSTRDACIKLVLIRRGHSFFSPVPGAYLFTAAPFSELKIQMSNPE